MMAETTSALSVGDRVPDFDLPGSGNRRIRLEAMLGKPFVLYFYPKADTTGCTQEAREFMAASTGQVPVIGVSRDPIKAVEAFAGKLGTGIILGSDEDGSLSDAFGVWVQKSMYGRSYMGIERSSFLIGADGRIAQAWRKVKVPGHAAAVMKAAASLA